MSDLENLYAAWRSQSFPPGSSNDSLDEFHADLALADTWVAETVIPYVEHGLNRAPNFDIGRELDSFYARAGQLISVDGGEERRLAERYRD